MKKMKKGQKYLYNVIKKELKENENIFVTTQAKLNDISNKNWQHMEEYTYDQIFNNLSGNEIVKKYWHEEGLCIILNK